MALPYARPSDLLTAAWSLETGAALTGYGVDRLQNLDPSYPLWLSGTSIRVTGDLGSAMRVDAVVLVHHAFAEGLVVRIEMNSSASWGTPPLRFDVIVPAWYADGFARHVAFDLATAFPDVSTRSYRYLSISTPSANTQAVRIGEIAIVSTLRTLTRGMLAQTLQTNRQHGASALRSKKGVQTVFDRRTRYRSWSGDVASGSDDDAALTTWIDAAHGIVSPYVVWPEGETADEPVFARFLVDADTRRHSELKSQPLVRRAFAVEELSGGEAY